uniref:MADF domain-containing protein n=1 Tax=Anopheles funestus TaxID=62324 RepID=A0A182S3P5_ANOFN
MDDRDEASNSCESEQRKCVDAVDLEEPFLTEENDSMEFTMSKYMSIRMEMSKEKFVLMLIHAIRKLPILWKQNAKGYRDPTLVQEAWDTLSQQFELPAEHLKEKWQTLRSQLRSINSKMKRNHATLDKNYRPTWFAYEAMRFLKEPYDKQTETPVVKQPHTVTIKQPVPTKIAVKQHMQSPVAVSQRLSTPITVKRIVPNSVSHPSLVKPSTRVCKRRYMESTLSSSPKVMRRMPATSSSSKIQPFIIRTFENLSKITDKIAQTEASPYSGLLNHLSVVLSKKCASDFNQIEAILLNCLNELQKLPNAEKDPIGYLSSTVVIDERYSNEEEREDSDDPYT